MAPNLRAIPGGAVPPVSAERAALREAVAEAAEAREALEQHGRHQDDLRRRYYLSTEAVEGAVATLRLIQIGAAEHLANPHSPPPGMTVRDARRALEDAQDQRDALRAALDAPVQGLSPQTRLDSAERAVRRQIVKLVSETAARDLVAEYRRRLHALVDLRDALRFLDIEGAIPDDIKGWGDERGLPPMTIDSAWRAAFDRLAHDADAPLPELSK
jgi:hypothetical protein